MPNGKLKESEVLWIYSMGKRFQVRAMFADTEQGTRDTNAYCERHDEVAVIATIGGVIFVANKYEGVLQ